MTLVSSSPLLACRSAARTGIGSRASNQDAMLVDDEQRFWAVADGIGGVGDGGWAARKLIAALSAYRPATSPEASSTEIAQCVADCGAVIAASGPSEANGSGTTLCLLAVVGDALVYGWSGDSRIYRRRGTTVEQLTRDHSVVEDLVARGGIARDDADVHPLAHVLTRAIGVPPYRGAEMHQIAVCAGDRFLLCTDGVSRGGSGPVIAAALNDPDIEAAAEMLLANGLAKPGADNTTLIIVDVAW